MVIFKTFIFNHIFNRYIKLISLILIFLFSHQANAQWQYEISGTVNKSGKRLEGAIITIYKGGTQIQQVVTSANGKFNVNLDQDAEYRMDVTKPGFITKTFLFSTLGVPPEIASIYRGGAKPDISIFELPKDPQVVSQINQILSQPIAKFMYNTTLQDIVFDEGYSQSMLKELNRLNQLEKEVNKKTEDDTKQQQSLVTASESKYNAAILKGDEAFSKRDFLHSKEAYQDALTIKQKEKYPLEKISEIEKLIAESLKKSQLDTDYNAAIKKGDEALLSKKLDIAKSAYNEALTLKPSEKYSPKKLEEIQKMIAEGSKTADLNTKYDAAINKGDKDFTDKKYELSKTSYKEALSLKPTEKYPKIKIEEIDKLLTELNSKEQLAKELTEKYAALIAKADKSFSAKEYANAKMSYEEGLKIKQEETYPKTQLAEIEKRLAEASNNATTEKDRLAKEKLAKEQNEKYAAVIAKADKAFSAKEYANAKISYEEGLKIKQEESYPKTQLAEIEKRLAELSNKATAEKDRLAKEQLAKDVNEKYAAVIAMADKLFSAKDYSNAKISYEEGLKIKQEETYPKTQLAEIEKRLAELSNKATAEKDRLTKEQLAKEIKEKYAAVIAKADKAFSAKEYANAKISYEEGLKIKQEESYPKTQLAEIEKRLAELSNKATPEKDLLAKEQLAKDVNEKYAAVIAKADKSFSAKDYSNAKSSYEDGLKIKQEETYPKTQLAEIEKRLAEASNNATAEKDRLAKEQLAKELNEKYAAVIAKADKAFSAKEYANAKMSYEEGLKIKQEETYPKTQLAEIEKRLAEASNKATAEKGRLAKDQLAKELNEKYAAVIAKADKAFGNREYKEAKSSYLDAAIIKATEKYPKDKVIQIDLLLNKPSKPSIKAENIINKDDFKNDLVKKYPEGITEEYTTEGNAKVTRRIVIKGNEGDLYLKKVTSFGAIYYFKNNVPILEAEYLKFTEPK
ncbi:MAG: hypothetical protein ABI315_06880 [Bacteroidia bacterium]